MEILDGIASSHRRQPSSQTINIKTEPLADGPIPPQSASRSRYMYHDVDDEMVGQRPDRDRRPSTSGARNRYAQLPGRPPPPESEATALQRELRDVRRHLTADIAEERKIRQQLRRLGAEEPSSDSYYGDDFVTRARIQQLEDDLEYERARRRRLEEIVGDIRRECREPFVVPALLDAFVQISKLTNEAMEED